MLKSGTTSGNAGKAGLQDDNLCPGSLSSYPGSTLLTRPHMLTATYTSPTHAWYNFPAMHLKKKRPCVNHLTLKGGIAVALAVISSLAQKKLPITIVLHKIPFT